ncbi:hypothetical protein FVE85_2207 [Porphyridium purpureum]|uniref:Uncharacterized protein n=1 Tax=Porphyridium purpureum TaxID=35688 RepID=A0A5J4YYT6_PORPP|nr:hypothetical protein FVE85_2207 [Porphyridium purpureum]|eukprot:POR6068..scf209_3
MAGTRSERIDAERHCFVSTMNTVRCETLQRKPGPAAARSLTSKPSGTRSSTFGSTQVSSDEVPQDVDLERSVQSRRLDSTTPSGAPSSVTVAKETSAVERAHSSEEVWRPSILISRIQNMRDKLDEDMSEEERWSTIERLARFEAVIARRAMIRARGVHDCKS